MNRILLLMLIVFFNFTNGWSQTYTINLSKSSIHWVGEKITGQHDGAISISSGELILNKDQLISGEFIIDMSSITCTDISNEQTNKKFISHLKSDDFFGVNKHPKAKLSITKFTKIDSKKSKADAMLTIKGITNPISFVVEKKDSFYSAEIIVDRSKYDIKYRSSSFFENLGDKLIYDEFKLDVEIALNL